MAVLDTDFPLPVPGSETVIAPAPGPGPGNWAGGPSGAVDVDGTLVIAYRVRTAGQRGAAIVVARSEDGRQLSPLTTLEKARFRAESLERPALVRTGTGWRLYVSCATPGSKHWRIDCLEALDPAGFANASARTILAGNAHMGVKDPVIRRRGNRWLAWICCHPLDVPGDEDRMTTRLASSEDGLDWQWQGVALSGRPRRWDARGARVTALLPDGRASYDGRATRMDNFVERTGLARPAPPEGTLIAVSDQPVSPVRYLDIVALAGGSYQLFFEMPREDGSHDLCGQQIHIA